MEKDKTEIYSAFKDIRLKVLFKVLKKNFIKFIYLLITTEVAVV